MSRATELRLPDFGDGAAVLAFDVGGTNVKSAVIDAQGRAHGARRRPSPGLGPNSAGEVLDLLAEEAERLRPLVPDAPIAVGLAIPGIVDEPSGIGVFSENLGWRDVPFAALAEARLGVPVALRQDVRAAGEAELLLGAGLGFDDVLVVVVGTGISAAIFSDRRLIMSEGYAGEIGHLRIPGSPAPCVCGATGCIEAIASASAIARRYGERSGTPVAGAEHVVERMLAGDRHATEVWREAVEAIARGLFAAVSVVAPQAIIVGGGLSLAGDALFEPLRAELYRLITFHRRPVMLPATIGDSAGLAGAVLRGRALAAVPR